MEKGKKLEKYFKDLCKKHSVYCHRFKDARSMGSAMSTPSPADFFIYVNGKLTFIECKECSEDKFYFSRIRPSQFKAFFECQRHGIDYIVVIMDMRNKQVYQIEMQKIMSAIESKEGYVFIKDLRILGLFIKK